MTTKNHPSALTAQTQLSLFPQVKQESPALDTVHQYFFIISPPDTVKNKVRSLKQKLNKAVGLSDYNLHSIAHISLMSFHTMRPVNDRFIQAVQQLFSNNEAFEVNFNGFEHFEHGAVSNTIYAKLHNSDQIIKIYRELHILLGLKVRSFVPHLTIARTISRHSFQKSFSLVNKNTFNEKFLCNSVTILERKLQHGVVGKYSVLKEIKLNA
jgi:2'-5' RNA ligase